MEIFGIHISFQSFFDIIAVFYIAYVHVKNKRSFDGLLEDVTKFIRAKRLIVVTENEIERIKLENKMNKSKVVEADCETFENGG